MKIISYWENSGILGLYDLNQAKAIWKSYKQIRL